MTDLTPEHRAELRRSLHYGGYSYFFVEHDTIKALLDTADERDNQKTESPVLSVMIEYARAVLGNPSEFDGYQLQAVIEDWVRELRQPDPSHNIEWHRHDLGICMAGGGHWCGHWGGRLNYCDDTCGCVPCAEDRSRR